MLLAVGKSTGLQFAPMKATGNAIDVYRIVDNRLSLLHSTPVDGVVAALTQCQGRLLAGVGGKVALFDMGKKQLLRKSQVQVGGGGMVKTVAAAGERIFVGTIGDSVKVLKLDLSSMKMFVVCDDVMPR